MPMILDDIGSASTPEEVEETGSGHAPSYNLPLPILLLVFAFLGYVALRKVWAT